MASIFQAGKAGIGNVIKNKIGGKWIGWRAARVTAGLLEKALGEDVDNALDLIVSTGTAGEFGTAAAARFLTDEFRGKLSPGQFWLLKSILDNVSEHVYPEFVEEITRIRELHSTDSDAARAMVATEWPRMVDKAFASVNPSGETGRLRYLMPLGGATTYYAPGLGSGAFDRQKAAYDAAGYQQNYIHFGSRPADTRALSTEGRGLIYFEGEASFDEALADPNGQLCRADFPLIERAMQAQLKAQGGGESAWNRLTEAQRRAILWNESRLLMAVANAERLAENEGRIVGDVLQPEPDAMSAFLAEHANTIRDSATQMRDGTDFGLLRMLAEITWPEPLNDTATGADRARHAEETRLALHQTFSAIDRIGDQASADRRAEQALDNLRRWASSERRHLQRTAGTWVGQVIRHWAFYVPAVILTVIAIASAVVGFILIVWNTTANDLVRLADVPGRVYLEARVPMILLGIVLALPLAGVLYAGAGILEYAGGFLRALGRTASAVGDKVFGIQVAPLDAEEVFGRGRYLQRFAAGYLLVLLLLSTLPLGALEIDFFLCAHALSWGLRLVVVILLLGGGIVKAAGDLMKGLSAAANQELERNARRTFGWLQLIPGKAFLLLVIVVPLALPVVHMTGALKLLQRFQDEAVEYVDANNVLMPTGEAESIAILGGRQVTAKTCSNHRIHLPSGRLVSTNSWSFDREWNGVLLAVSTVVDLLKAHLDKATGLLVLDGFDDVTLEGAFPGATISTKGLVVVDPSRSGEFIEGTPDENFVVQPDGFVRVEPRPRETSAASKGGVTAFLKRVPWYALLILSAVLGFAGLMVLPEKLEPFDVPGTERSVRFVLAVTLLAMTLGAVVAWVVRSALV